MNAYAYILQEVSRRVTGQLPSPPVDRFGIIASVACALHCVATALIPTALAMLGASALLEHEAEWVFTLIAVSAASLALLLGWRRRGWSGASWGLAVGIAGLLGARFLEDAGGHGHGLGVALSVLSGAALVTGHVLNLRRGAAVTAATGCDPRCTAE